MADTFEARTKGVAAGPAVLELGDDIGAAVIYTKGVHDGAEIEIKLHGSEWNGHHTAIRRRPSGHRRSEDIYAALFYGLPAGRYDLRLRSRPLGENQTIEILGGRITQVALIG